MTSDSPVEDIPAMNEAVDRMMPWLRQTLPQYFDAASTKEVSRITLQITEALGEILESDMLNTYFYLPENSYDSGETGLTLSDLKRTDPLANCDVLDKEKRGDEDVHEQEMPTWHRETSDMAKSFFRFELERGSRTDLLGSSARPGEDGDQALAMVQGSARQTKRNDYAKRNEVVRSDDYDRSGKGKIYGKENRYAEAVFLVPYPPSREHIAAYEQMKTEILPYQKN